MEADNIIFSISVEYVQEEALNIIGRTLSPRELDLVRKGLESGLHFDLETVVETAIEEAVSDLTSF